MVVDGDYLFLSLLERGFLQDQLQLGGGGNRGGGGDYKRHLCNICLYR